jgi:FkbM family methyltransferase
MNSTVVAQSRAEIGAQRARLERLLAESPASAQARARDTLEQKIGSLERDFVLFGAGNLGRKALKMLRGIGKEPVAFIDNNPALWGTQHEGVKICSPGQYAQQFDSAQVGVITTIWCGEATDTMADRIGPLRQSGFRDIAYFGHLAWHFPDVFLPHYSLDLPSKVLDEVERIERAFSLLADDESRKLFVDHVEWRLTLDYDLLPPPAPDMIYFNKKFVNTSAHEVLYDVGAYIGDSVEDFLKTDRGPAFAQIHAFEPAANNFVKLKQYCASLGALSGKVFPHHMALGNEVGSIQVEASHGPASRVGLGQESVAVTTIDLFAEEFAAPTFIKIDIEGFEPQCLEGAQRCITRDAPVVAVCAYHVQSHLWDLLLQLHEYNPDYTYRFGPHLADGWDLVLYAVPKHRLPA